MSLMSHDDYRALTYEAKPTLLVTQTAAQTISNNSLTAITYNVDTYDRWGMHNTSSNTEKLTVVVPGIYLISAYLSWTTDVTGTRQLSIRHYNSSNSNRLTLAFISVGANPSAETGDKETVLSVTALSLVAVSGDYFRINAYQTSGGDLDVLANSCRASVVWQSRG